MKKILAIAIMLLAVIMAGCNSKSEYEDNVRRFNTLSMELMYECAHQLGNIYDDKEYKAQSAIIDSINGEIIPLYDKILTGKEENEEYFYLVKEMRRAEISMMSSLEMQKMNDEIGDLEMRNKFGDDYAREQTKLIDASNELSLILPKGNQNEPHQILLQDGRSVGDAK